MKEKVNDEIVSWINKLNIKDELKQELNYFNEKVTEIKKAGSNLNFNVIIDERSKEDINTLLEYMTTILEKYEIYKEFIKYKGSIDILDIHDSVIIVNDFGIFYDCILDSYRAERKLSDFFEDLRNNGNMLILTCTNKIRDNFKKIGKEIFNPDVCIHIKRNSNLELYRELINRYDDNNIKYNLSYSKFINILDSVNVNSNSNIYSIDYLYDYSVKKMILNNGKMVSAKIFDEFITNKKTKPKQKMDDLIGLDNIKKEFDKLYKYLKFIKKLRIKDNIYLNLFFLGNPGTGKTTVARMYAEKLYKLGFIEENKLIETVPTDLIGEYVGQTRNTIRKILDKARGGILFIDEAYLLYSSNYNKGENPFMEEAVVELLKYLDNPKNIVIFAGYPAEMKKIYDANPGIKSRIYQEIIFNDYSSLELYQILEKDLNKKKLNIDIKSKNKIIKYIDELRQEKNFGNARSMLKKRKKMIMNHANNVEDTLLINAKDLPENGKKQNNKEKMGFGIYD